ncbi:hypothetical protein L596_015931 [Steinernema carpocapsae]|nr:hypothetical protein L596_015931 [Steinernema carpocapsae]
MIFFNIAIITLYAAIFILYKRYVNRSVAASISAPKNNFQAIVYGVMAVYFVFWCVPKWIMFGLKIFNYYNDLTNSAAFLIELSESFSACLNIIIYGYAHRELRQAMGELLSKTPFRKMFGTVNSTYVRSGNN